MTFDTDLLIYNALKADGEIMEATNGRIISTCIEVPPTEKDNTPLPYIIVGYDGMNEDNSNKDASFGTDNDIEDVFVEVSASSRNALVPLMRRIRKCVHDYMVAAQERGEDVPEDYSVSASGVAWDWTKPCYYQTMNFHCSTNNDF